MVRKKTYKDINIEREKVLLKGYANLTDIKRFIPCGDARAKRINEEITKSVVASGKRVYMGIRAKYLLDCIGLTEKQVHDYAELERKKAAAATATNKIKPSSL